ncbi:MerR family transcriptional regulator [Alicyclobacillus fodiniaquatilis]|uniref:MerR family transcriptional regulator n=1 Tax=Alicyclobacillus fodiniaquatilis TaxID=1661150 RepID=A0ABW4JNA5_9BACL
MKRGEMRPVGQVPQKQYIYIAELAKRLSISARAIRFYEEQGLIHPAKDPNNDYRLFTESDILRLQTILLLREIGMSLADIGTLLDEMESNHKDIVANYLEMQRSALYAKWIELSRTIRSTEQLVERFYEGRELADEGMMTLSNGLKQLRRIRESTHTYWDFNANAASFDEHVLTVTEPWIPYSGYEAVLDSIIGYLCPSKNERGLELAIGTGNLSAKCVAQGAKMYGVDQSFEMLRQCRSKYPGIHTKLGNMMAAPFFDHQFDFIVSSYAFHLLTFEQQFLSLREMDRLLVNGGRVCIADHMFVNEVERIAVLERLKTEKDEKGIRSVESHSFAYITSLTEWFTQQFYTTQLIRVHESVYLLLAYKPM